MTNWLVVFLICFSSVVLANPASSPGCWDRVGQIGRRATWVTGTLLGGAALGGWVGYRRGFDDGQASVRQPPVEPEIVSEYDCETEECGSEEPATPVVYP